MSFCEFFYLLFPKKQHNILHRKRLSFLLFIFLLLLFSFFFFFFTYYQKNYCETLIRIWKNHILWISFEFDEKEHRKKAWHFSTLIYILFSVSEEKQKQSNLKKSKPFHLMRMTLLYFWCGFLLSYFPIPWCYCLDFHCLFCLILEVN